MHYVMLLTEYYRNVCLALRVMKGGVLRNVYNCTTLYKLLLYTHIENPVLCSNLTYQIMYFSFVELIYTLQPKPQEHVIFLNT